MNAAGLNENVLYAVCKWKDEYVIVAEKRLGELQMRTGSKFKKLIVVNGDSLDSVVVEHPIFSGKNVPVVINNEVTSFFGTGISAICPAHNVDSLKVAYHYNLPKNGYVDEKGILTEDLGPIY